MHKNISWLLVSSLLLTGCNGGAAPVDATKFLSDLEGPKVPTVSDTLTESAQNAEKKGDFKQAVQLYQQILEKHPENKEVALSLADAYRRSGDLERAIALYDGLIAQDPLMLGAKEGKGLALMAKGDFDTPSALFADVMKTDDKRWKTLNALGILFAIRNMHPEAQQYFNEALKFHPDSPSILNNMGLSQALDRHYSEGLASLTQAAKLAGVGTPQRKRIDLNTALVYAIDGKMDEARTLASNYYTGPALDNNLGLYAHLAKDDQMARTYLNMALTESKTFYEKAWGNLKEIDEHGTPADAAGPAEATDIKINDGIKAPAEPAEPEPEPKKPAKKHVKHKATAVNDSFNTAPTDDISRIVDSPDGKDK
jgi:Flp pilus assembly protein TadD